MKRPTIADIARRAGVSKGAVSYALNGQPGVSEATRQRILAIAEEIGFNPNSAARALSGAAANAVGLALCRPARILGVEPFFMELISGVEAELSARSYALTLQVVADQDAEIAVYRRWWGERRVDGVLDLRPARRRPPGARAGEAATAGRGDRRPGRHRRAGPVWSDEARRARRDRGVPGRPRPPADRPGRRPARPAAHRHPHRGVRRRRAGGSGWPTRSPSPPTTPARTAPGPPGGCSARRTGRPR